LTIKVIKILIIDLLKHDENCSSFKRIQFHSTFPPENYTGRVINFEGGAGSAINNDQLGQRRKVIFKNEGLFSESSEDIEEEDAEEAVNAVEDGKYIIYKGKEKKFKCTCNKSQCLKKYCECYAAGAYCDGCDCTNCYNTPSFSEMIKRSIEYRKDKEEDTSLAENMEISCNCTKSNCKKKYCECYKAGEGCKESCRCINCSNNKEIAVHKKKSSKKCSPEDYIIEGISVFISNNDVSISFSKNMLNNDKKIGKIFKVNNVQPETPKMIKKRNRSNNKIEETQKSKSTNITSTPLFTTSCNGSKTKKINIEEENKIIKNLDKMY
jgi:hypothetical protein